MTIYWLKLRYHRTGHEVIASYESATARAIAKITISPYADIVEEGEREA